LSFHRVSFHKFTHEKGRDREIYPSASRKNLPGERPAVGQIDAPLVSRQKVLGFLAAVDGRPVGASRPAIWLSGSYDSSPILATPRSGGVALRNPMGCVLRSWPRL